MTTDLMTRIRPAKTSVLLIATLFSVSACQSPPNETPASVTSTQNDRADREPYRDPLPRTDPDPGLNERTTDDPFWDEPFLYRDPLPHTDPLPEVKDLAQREPTLDQLQSAKDKDRARELNEQAAQSFRYARPRQALDRKQQAVRLDASLASVEPTLDQIKQAIAKEEAQTKNDHAAALLARGELKEANNEKKEAIELDPSLATVEPTLASLQQVRTEWLSMDLDTVLPGNLDLQSVKKFDLETVKRYWNIALFQQAERGRNEKTDRSVAATGYLLALHHVEALRLNEARRIAKTAKNAITGNPGGEALFDKLLAVVDSLTPADISPLEAYLEGPNLKIYFCLQGRDGNPTAGAGSLTIRIRTYYMGRELDQEQLANYSQTEDVAPNDFKEIVVGRGAFARRVLAYVFPPIPWEDVIHPQVWQQIRYEPNFEVRVMLRFRPKGSGEELESYTTVR